MPEQVTVKSPWESMDVKSLSQEIATKNEEQRTFYKANKDRWDDDRVTIFENRNKELKAMTERQAKLQKVEDIYSETVAQKKSMDEPAPHVPFENGGGDKNVTVNQGNTKSLGEMFTESQAYKSVGSHESSRAQYSVDIEEFTFSPGMKTVMTTSAGYAVPNPRTDIVVPFAQREPRLADLIPVDGTANTAIKYMEETTQLQGTNAQVGTAENALKFENALAFTERTANVGLVATWLPVTNQQLDDIPGMQGIINNRMTLFLRLKEEDMLLNGTGVSPINILGFLALPSINTQATGADTNLDAIFKGMQTIRVTGLAEPDAVVMHPTNFTPINLYKSTTGAYSFDVTQEQGIIRLFGKTLVLTPAMTVGTALVGSFSAFSHISRKMGLTVTVGLNADDFTKNKKTILAEFRESLEVYRQTAFTKVTGLV
jgi:HK97 family phage major capsid protein